MVLIYRRHRLLSRSIRKSGFAIVKLAEKAPFRDEVIGVVLLEIWLITLVLLRTRFLKPPSIHVTSHFVFDYSQGDLTLLFHYLVI